MSRLLCILLALSAPTQIRVHAYLFHPPAPQAPFSPVPPTHESPARNEIFVMRTVSHLHALLKHAWRARILWHTSYALIVSLSCKTTASVHAMLAAWKPHMLRVPYNCRASCVQGALYAKAAAFQALLAHHWFTPAYAPKLSLFSFLLGVYQQQVRTIEAAILHHMSLSHHGHTMWSSMMVYRMRAHEYWLSTPMEQTGRLYDRAFHTTSRTIRHWHATLVSPRLNEPCASAVPKNTTSFPNGEPFARSVR